MLELRNVFVRHVLALLVSACALGAQWFLVPVLQDTAPYLVLYPVVLLVAVLFGKGPGLTAAVLSVLAVENWLGQSAPTEATLLRASVFLCSALCFGELGNKLRRARNEALQAVEAMHDAEAELSESHEHYRVLAEAVFDGVVIHDGRVILQLNDAFCRIVGRDRGNLIGREIVELVAPAARGRFNEYVHATGHTAYELEFLDASGGTFTAEVRAKDIRYEGEGARLAVIRDISERRKIEQHQQETEEKLRLVVESAPNAFVMTNQKGRIVLVNSQTERLFGYGREELLGKPVEMLVPATARGEHVSHRHKFYGELKARPMGAGRDLYGVRKDGKQVPVEIGLSPIPTREGTLVLAAVVDITQRKRAEEALKEADRKKDEFLAVLAHELRNPMAAISAAAKLMAMPGVSAERMTLAKDALRQRVAQLARLIDDLLDVSRIVRGKIQLRKELLDLSAVINAAVEATRSFFEERGHTLRVRAETALPVVGDPVRLEQVITNLLGNAAKYTENGGNISLTAAKNGGQAVIRVKDNGIGIPHEALPRIFELFGQVDDSLHRSPGGLGIGLSIVKKLTEMHGGTVTAESDGPGTGTEFMVTLPLSAVQPGVRTEAEAVQVTPGLRILVVEDHRDTAFMAAASLELEGHKTEIAYDGISGLKKALDSRPDVILLDLGLPGLDGFSVARELRERGLNETLIIAITGYGQERDFERSKAAGINHHLLKPLEHNKLAALLQAWQTKRQDQGLGYQ